MEKRKCTYHLVRFVEDNLLHICSSRHVSCIEDKRFAKYKNGSRYEAKILDTSEDLSYLKTVRENIEIDLSTSILTSAEVDNLTPEAVSSLPTGDSSLAVVDLQPEVPNLSVTVADRSKPVDNDSPAHKHHVVRKLFSDDEQSSIFTDNVTEESENEPFSDNSDDDPNYNYEKDIHEHQKKFEFVINNESSPKEPVKSLMSLSDLNPGYSCERNLFEHHKKKKFKSSNNSSTSNQSDDQNQIFKKNIEKGKMACVKKNCCPYCKKLYSRLPDHLEMKHKDEKEVLLLSRMPKGSLNRKKILEALRREGNFKYSTNADKEKIIPCRRPQTKYGLRENHYIPCGYCKGLFSKLSLRKHVAKNHSHQKGEKNVMIMSRGIRLSVHDKASDILKHEVLPVLRNDEVSDIIKYDDIIIVHGNKLSIKYRAHRHHQKMIRQRLRQAARFLISIKMKDCSIMDLSSVFHPKHINSTIETINELGHFNEFKDEFETPSMASAIGTLLKDIGETLIIESMKVDDEDKIKQTERFLALLSDELKCKINKTVLENQKARTRTKKINLPTTTDIQMLYKFLTCNRQKLYEKLKDLYSFEVWKQHSEFTLINVQVFNRRRAGELERVYITDFKNFDRIDNNSEVYKKLDPSSQMAANQYVRFEIRGKLGRGVPVLLNNELVCSIELILKYRDQAGVSVKNPYIFGFPKEGNDFYHIKATDLMRKYSVECGAKNPSSLRGTSLRKHLATSCVTLNLKEQEISDVANFMGHHEKIHHQHYRLSVATKDIISMSNLLEQFVRDPTESHTFNNNIEELALDNNSTEYTNSDPVLQTSDSCTDSDDDSLMMAENSRKIRNTGIHKKFVKRTSWTSPEKNRVRELCDFTTFQLPSLRTCLEYKMKYPELKNRSPQQLKTWISNQYRLIKKVRDNLDDEEDKPRRKVTWSSAEKNSIVLAFADNLKKRKMPTTSDIDNARNEYPALKRRTPAMIKSKIYYILSKQQTI